MYDVYNIYLKSQNNRYKHLMNNDNLQRYNDVELPIVESEIRSRRKATTGADSNGNRD